MIRLNKKIFISIALTILIALILISPVFASTLDPNQYNPNPSLKGSTKFVDSAEKVLGVIKYIGIVVSVFGLAIIGIKYMISSVEGKAEYKKTMIPYIVGAVLIFAGTSLVRVIYSLANSVSGK